MVEFPKELPTCNLHRKKIHLVPLCKNNNQTCLGSDYSGVGYLVCTSDSMQLWRCPAVLLPRVAFMLFCSKVTLTYIEDRRLRLEKLPTLIDHNRSLSATLFLYHEVKNYCITFQKCLRSLAYVWCFLLYLP